MKLLILTSLTMVFFAANSVLNRLGVASGGISAETFALIRVVSGAIILLVLVAMRNGGFRMQASFWGVTSLAAYLVGFSQAYISLDAGLGALILFGGVQVTMFAGALWQKEDLPLLRWIGMGVALVGLVWLTGGIAASSGSALAIAMMSIAALGWGIYSLVGRGATDALGATAANFLWAVPLTALPLLISGIGPLEFGGVAAAVASGAICSALGYALWYRILPLFGAGPAGVVQLTVPVLALFGGAIILNEPITWRIVIASALVLGGIGLSLSAKVFQVGRR